MSQDLGIMKLLTMVIPYYNVKKYIKCLHASIFSQLTDDIELILVEDYSTDGTREYLQNLHHTNERDNVKFIFHDMNKGLSAARNTGLKHAVGKYVWFVDSDDALVEDSIKKLLSVIHQQNTDMIFFNFYFLNEEIVFERNFKYDNQVFMAKYFQNENIYAWMFVAKRELYNNIEFPVGQFYEDISTSPKLIQKSKYCYYSDETLIYYRKRTESIMGSPSVKSCLDYSIAMQSSVQFCQREEMIKEAREEMYMFYFKTLRWALNDMQDHNLINVSFLQAAFSDQK